MRGAQNALMSSDQPHFRFNPNAYVGGLSFEPSNDICEACSRPRVWKYAHNIYAARKPGVCARCISEGRLHSLLGDSAFLLHDAHIEDAEPALLSEVLHRTPGFATFNPFKWPVFDGKPLAFMGYGENADLFAMPSVRTAIREAFDAFGWDCEPSPYALVFKEIDGDRCQVSVDLD